ncbi:hypothetical protein VTO73DRAFT_6820 [Trametes versicolor]
MPVNIHPLSLGTVANAFFRGDSALRADLPARQATPGCLTSPTSRSASPTSRMRPEHSFVRIGTSHSVSRTSLGRVGDVHA